MLYVILLVTKSSLKTVALVALSTHLYSYGVISFTCLGLSPSWLQRYGTPPWFLTCLCLFTAVQAMVNSGLFPVIVSSIQREYGFTSKYAGGLDNVLI